MIKKVILHIYYKWFQPIYLAVAGGDFEELLRINTNGGFEVENVGVKQGSRYVGNNVFPINSHLANLPVLLGGRPLPYWQKGQADFFYIYGMSFEFFKHRLLRYAKRFGKAKIMIEDGFLRSIDLPIHEEGVSLLLDDVGIYYDARRPSRLENMLNSDQQLSDEEIRRARRVINKIRETKVTKYNVAPLYKPEIGRENAKKVLVIDQAFQDASIPFGLADDASFPAMLEAALRENPDADIIVKTHPEASRGMRKGYFTSLELNERIYPFTDLICPLSLIEYVDKVYCVTTQMGFEALMCGKPVTCFGVPFYSGWRLTDDRVACERRTKSRSLEEVFHFAYIAYSRYMNPATGKRCEVEEAIDYLVMKRDFR